MSYIVKRKASYVIKRKIRKYYKYVYQDWTQPVLTANGIMGGDKFAVSATQLNTSQVPYCAMDGKDSTQWYSKNTGYPIPYIFYSPQELDITKLEIRCWCDNGAFKSFEIQNSMDGNSWQTIWSGNSGLPLDNAIHTVTVDLSNIENRRGKYWKINFLTPVKSSSLVADMVDLFITATAKTGVKEVSASDDYDYYKDTVKSYIAKRKIRRYYKYVEKEVPFVQPVMTSLSSPTLSLLQSSELGERSIWKAFNPAYKNGSGWHAGGNNASFDMYFSLPTKVTSFDVEVFNGSEYTWTAYEIRGHNSSMGANVWDTLVTVTGVSFNRANLPIPENKQNFYEAYQIRNINCNYGYTLMDVCNINATQLTTVAEESTVDDYDFYNDDIINYIPKRKELSFTTFTPSQSLQEYIVPAGVNSLWVEAVSPKGSDGTSNINGTGGSGYYGGGGGGYDERDSPYDVGGGGGGSSYANPEVCSSVTHQQGANNSTNGYVKIIPIVIGENK